MAESFISINNTKIHKQYKLHTNTKKKSKSKYSNIYTTKHSISKNTQSFENSHKLSRTLLLGCHASIANGIIEGIKYVESIGGNAVQIFLGSNRSASLKTKHKFIGQNKIDEIKTYISRNKICLIIHSIYLLNFCKYPPSGHNTYMHDNIQYDLKYGAMLGVKCVVLHLGSRTNMDMDTSINNLVSNINKIINNMPDGIMISLETSAGSGKQIGWNLEELSIIWNQIKHNNKHNNKTKTIKTKSIKTKTIKTTKTKTTNTNENKVGICIDTAHIFVSGYDISTLSGITEYMKKFDSLIGIKNITNFHINDSKYALGTKHDEHRGIGQGLIYNSDESKKALLYIKKICIKHKISMILETHSAGSLDSEGSHKVDYGYEYEIDLIKKL